jgi:hypothetical protein
MKRNKKGTDAAHYIAASVHWIHISMIGARLSMWAREYVQTELRHSGVTTPIFNRGDFYLETSEL